MIKIDRNVNMLFLKRAAIIDMLDEAAHIDTGIEYPGNGFHSLYEAQFQTADGYTVFWAWVIGGGGDGIKYTVAVATNGDGDIKTGWERGHKSYVLERPVPREFTNAIRRLVPGKLLLIGELPGFDYDGHHKDGWYSKGLFAMELPVPDCLAINVECADPELVVQPECWRIKEGVYVVFPDDTYRLMAFQDYLVTRYWDRPALRQGDLMFFKLQWPIEFDDNGEPVHQHGYTFEMYPEGYSMDRHGVDGLVLVRKSKAEGVYEKDIFLVGPAMVKHPEHGELQIPEGQYEVVMLPGTSRPFQDGID
jgi:hypothetical protein